MGMISLQNASIGYSGQVLLSGVNLEIEPGEIVAICGPNGAGKSALLKSLIGILPLIKGQISYSFDLNRNSLGYVPQRDMLDPIFPLTALDVVLMGRSAKLGLFSSVGKRDVAIAQECLMQVQLGAMGNASFFELSGGQRQRVLIARALCAEPKILFLDEPTSGNDLGAEAAFIRLLLDLHAAHGCTVVLVSHHLNVVRDLVPNIIMVYNHSIEKGKAENMLRSERLSEIYGIREEDRA